MPSVVFVFLTQDRRLLVETRPESDSYFPGQCVYPGGKFVLDNESAYHAMLREAREELGRKVLRTYAMFKHRVVNGPDYANIDPSFDRPIYYGERRTIDFLVHPFLVTYWAPRDLPDHILDTGHPTSLITLDQAHELTAGCTVEITRRVEIMLAGNDISTRGVIFPQGDAFYAPYLQNPQVKLIPA